MAVYDMLWFVLVVICAIVAATYILRAWIWRDEYEPIDWTDDDDGKAPS